MAKIFGVNVIAPVVPFDTTDAHPSHEARYGKGGYRTVATLADRDAIPAPRREAGMLVFVTADQNIYTLGADLTTWGLLELGGGQPDSHAATHTAAGSDPLTLTVAQVTGLQSALDGKQASGTYATLVGGKVPAEQLPSYVDDIIEAANLAALPGTGASGVLYVTLDTNKVYRWSGSAYVEVSAGASSWSDITGKPSFAAVATSGAYSDLAGTPAAYSLPTATGSVLGGVRIGSGVTIDGSGVISVSTAYAAASHSHAIADVTGLQTALDGKQASGSYAATVHTHGISDVTGLQTALDGKAASLHTHSVGDITSGTFDIARLPVGTSSTTVAAGNDARFTDARTPTGAAGGDLTGTYPNPTLANSGVSAGTYTSVTVDAKGRVTAGTNPVGGTKTIIRFAPGDNQPPASNFATLDTRNSILVLEFDAATQESANFIGVIPEGATLTNGLTTRIWWMGDTATTGNVRWGVSFERVGTDNDADSFSSVTEATGAANGTSGIETVTSITATAIDSLVAGDRFRLRVARIAADATNDTMTGDAQLVAVEVQVA